MKPRRHRLSSLTLAAFLVSTRTYAELLLVGVVAYPLTITWAVPHELADRLYFKHLQ